MASERGVVVLRQPALAGLDWRRWLGRDWTLGYIMVVPVLAVLVGLIAYPFFNAIALSFQDRPIGATGRFIGWQNYLTLLRDLEFRRMIGNTVLYTTVAVAFKTVLGMGMALVLNQNLVWRNLWRAALLLPWAVPVIVSCYVWRFIYDEYGLINLSLYRLGLITDFIYFLSKPGLAMAAIIVVVVWQGTPFFTMNFLAGMQAISGELYEAAEIDGANVTQRFRHVTIPGLRHVMTITMLLSTIWTASSVIFVFALTNGSQNTQVMSLFALQTAMGAKQLGLAAAVPVIFFPLFCLLILFLTRQMLREEE